MKKLSVIFVVLSALLSGGAYAVYYFTAHRMGMLRWVNRHAQDIRETIPCELVSYLVLGVVALATVLLVWSIVHHAGHAKTPWASIIAALVFIIAFAATALLVTRDISRADIFIIALMALAAIVQVIHLCYLAKTR